MADKAIESQTLIDALEDLFARERQALLAGDLDAVMRLEVQRDALLGRIQSIRASQPVLEKLRAEAARNAGLLAAAAQGVRAASARVRSLIDGPAPLSTYDIRGQRQQIGGAEAATLRRL